MGDHLILREGRTGKFFRDRLFTFSMSSTRKFIFRYTKARLFIFIRNKILKKRKKKIIIKKPQKPLREGGSECWFRRVPGPGQDFPWDFFNYFCTLPGSVCACAYILWYLKELLLKGVLGSSPKIIFSNFHTKWCHFRQF